MVLMMLGLLALLGSALASASSGNLVLSRHSAQAERALALADTGLTTGVQKLITTGSLGAAGETFPNEGSYVLERRINASTSGSMATPWGVQIPPKSTLLRCTGTTVEGVSRVSMALFRSNAGAFQVGALADSITGSDSTFDAYDSSLETVGYTGLAPEPASVVTGSTILASNRNSGTVVNLTASNVAGAAYAGPGGSASQIVFDAASLVGLTGTLAGPIEQPPITVPSMPNGPSTTPANTANPKTVYLKSPSGTTDTSITPPGSAGGPVTLTHYCLTLKVYPDGNFSAREAGSGSEIKGNIQDGSVSQVSPPSGSRLPLTVNSFSPLDIRGNWHHVVYDPASSSVAIDQQGIRTPAPAPTTHANLAPWIFYTAPAPAAVSPATLQPGKYDTVNVQGNMTSLVDGGVYVVKNLKVDSLGKIYLGASFSNVKIFVTGSLLIDGAEAIVNDSRKPTALKIFYTGTNPVTLSGGASAFASLYAPKADVTLSGYDSAFYGAISCKTLSIHNAAFHYDVSTQGIGTGLDSSAFQLLARYHP
ncbi:hypothetical protein ABS71_13400 [bacterium SCN 62-11]|nr:MAG: hypothetical protein ABS71_13400 [bacterium SCN 62-11]